MSFKNIDFSYKNIKKLVFNKKFIVVFLIFLYTISWLIGFVFVDKKRGDNLKITDLPYQEKVADEVWKLKNRDPIKQVLAQGPKADLNLKEIKSEARNPKSETYKWEVTISSGTKFEFGGVSSDTPERKVIPSVKITNSQGYFVEYQPKSEARNPKSSIINHFVTPTVKGNVISWEISKGVVARYTMMQDRVKADYIVNDKWLMVNGQKTKWDGRLDFDATSGNEKDSKQALKGELMPGGDIDWFTEISNESGPIQTHFTFPKPVIKDSSKLARPRLAKSGASDIDGEYDLTKIKDGEYELAIVLDSDQLKSATWPLTIDPVTIDAAATTTSTAYGNARHIIRDAWGNLIVVVSEVGGANSDAVWYKTYTGTTWSDAGIDLDGTADGFNTTNGVAADIDSSQNIHVAFDYTNAAANPNITYVKLTVARSADNAITGITRGTSINLAPFTTSTIRRTSLIIANKGGGAGVEKIAFVFAMNGTNRGEIRFMQCDVADDCTTAASWKNASEEIDGSGTCSDTATSGAAGLPNAVTCKGTADKILGVATTTTHHAVLTQIPGKPKRSPASVKKDINGTFTTLTNTIDNNTGTTDDVNSLTTTDYIYVGDDKPFSKATFDVTNTNTGSQTFSPYQYWNGASWVTLTNIVDNTITGNCATSCRSLGDDGTFLFDEPSNWVTTTVDGVSKYWIRLRPSGAFDSTVSIAEVYINDRNSKALLVVGGVDSTDDLGASYVIWDEINNDRWEKANSTGNTTGNVGAPWREGITALDTLGGDWTAFTNFPLSATVDYKNNVVFVGYVCNGATEFQCSSNFDDLIIKSIPSNKDVTISTNWKLVGGLDVGALTIMTDTVLSLTSDGADIYIFYVTDVGVTSLVYRKCTGSVAGLGGICDNGSEWGTEKTLVNSTDVSHPQAVVTKVTGDTVAIDTIYTMPTALDVVYERHYVDLADKTITVAASSDDAWYKDCDTGTDDQVINTVQLPIGDFSVEGGCASGPSQNHAGFRFPSITVAQGAAISSAYIDIKASWRNGSADLDFTIYGDDADNSAAFSALTDCTDPCGLKGLTRTTSSTVIASNFSTNTYRIDVTDIVQEIVCRGAANSQPCVGDFNGSGTWASGNAISLVLITNEATVDNYMELVSQDSTDAFTPTIQINVGSTGKNYSLGSAVQLATGSASFADFDHPLSAVEMGAVATDDTNYASVSATTNYASQSAQPAFMFKENNSNNNNTYKIDASAIVKSTVPTSSKPVYFQVYRGGSTDDWVTMASNNNTAADNDITLTSPSISTSTSEYYFNETPGIGTRYAECTTATANCWTYWRVYQDNPTTTFNDVLAVDYLNVAFAPAGPDKIAFSNAARTLTAAACNGAASVFTMELQSGTTPTNPLSTTVVRVTSNSSSYTIYSDDTCSTTVTNGDFTYTTAQNTKSVYIIDNKKSITTRTLTGTRQSGDTLTTGTQNYSVNAGAVSKLVITLPGQTFTDGTGNSGTVTNQVSGIRFPIQINATDANFNFNTSYTGDKVLVFSGPGVGTSTPTVLDKNNVEVNYGSNTTITFSSGTAASIQTTLYKGETTTITATDGGSYGNASSSLTIDAPSTKIRGGSSIRGGTKIQ